MHNSHDFFEMNSAYPQPGVILCRVVGRGTDEFGREVVTIELYGWEDRFDVFPAALVEGEYNSTIQRPWNGCAEPNATYDNA